MAAGGAADGAVIIDVDLDVSSTSKEFKKLENDIKKLQDSINSQESKKAPLVEQAQRLEQRMKAARAEVDHYRASWMAGVVGADKQQTAATEKAQRLEEEYAKIVSRINKIDEKLQPAYSQLDGMKKNAGELAKNMSKASSDTSKMDKATKKAHKSMGVFASRLRGIVLSAFVFNILSAGLRNLTRWLGETIKSNAEATAAIAKLKGALLTLVQPLVNVIIPAFITFINVLTKVVSAIASVISALFGTTVKQSAEAAENLHNEQNALEGVGGAASKAEKQLASFDEINKLSSASGGADPDSTIMPDFSGIEEISPPKWLNTIIEWFKDVGKLIPTDKVEKLKDAFNHLKESLSDLLNSEGFKRLAGWLAGVFLSLSADGMRMLAGFVELLEGLVNLNWKTIDKGLGGIASGFSGFFGSLGGDAGAKIFDKIFGTNAWTERLEHIRDTFAEYGLIEGLWIGMKEDWEKIVEWWNNSAIGAWWTNNVQPWFTKEKWVNLWGNVKSAFVSGWRNISTWWASSGLKKWWDESVKPWFTKEKWIGLWNAVKTAFITKWNEIKLWWDNTAIANWWNNSVKPWFTKEKWIDVMNGVKEGFITVFKNAVNGAIDLFNRFIDWVNEKMKFEWPSFSILGQEIIPAGSVQLFTIPHIPRLATGAVIPPNREFLAVLGDQRRGNNIEAPEALIRKIVREEAGNSGSGDTTIIMEVDRQQFAKLVYKANQNESRRIGVRLVEV